MKGTPSAAMMERNPGAACPEEMDMEMLQELVWSLRRVIEMRRWKR